MQFFLVDSRISPGPLILWVVIIFMKQLLQSLCKIKIHSCILDPEAVLLLADIKLHSSILLEIDRNPVSVKSNLNKKPIPPQYGAVSDPTSKQTICWGKNYQNPLYSFNFDFIYDLKSELQ